MSTAPGTPRRLLGFTIVECVIALAVVGMLIRMSLPAIGSMFTSVGLYFASNDVVAHLHLARTEAMVRNQRVTLCKSADGVNCMAAGGWEQGWMVFQDANHNAVLDPGEELIARHEALSLGLKLTGNQQVVHYVSYDSQGISKLVNGGFQAGTLTLCRPNPGPTEARQVIVNSVGRPRMQKTTVPQC